jgi:tetratricopeptide (TPR) repeat protein
MTLRLPNPAKLLAAAAAFLVALGVFALLNHSRSPVDGDGAAVNTPPAGSSTDSQIRAHQGAVRAKRRDPRGYAALAADYLQKVRETGDPTFYSKADGLLKTAHRLAPRNVDVLTGMGTLALARHDFRGALRLGLAAHGAAPELVKPYPVIVDAQVELGRYGEAGRTLQRMVDLKPTLAAYARVSYFRELHGDLRGAAAAMRLAVSAGGGVPENAAYVQTLLGNLELQLGHARAARTGYETALARFPSYVPAMAGLARVDVARGGLPSAIRRYRQVVDRLPLPEYVVGLGQSELAAGRRAQARRDLALVQVEQRLLAANGVNTDVDLALFQADHGRPTEAVSLARRAWRAAPSVRSADALGWALTRDGRPVAGLRWSKRALALGSRDSTFLYHAGMAARAAGLRSLARAYLSKAVALNPRFSPMYGPRAHRALEELG